MTSNLESTGNVNTNFSIRQLIIVTLLSWLSQIGFDLFQNAGLFAKLWLESSAVFLPPEKMFKLIPLGYLSFLISSSMLVWLMVGLGISGWRNGALFGLKIGSFLSFAMVLGMASVFPVKSVLLAAWLFGGIGQNSIAALVIGSGLKRNARLGRLTIKVITFVIISAIVVIIMQNLGMSPAMEYVK